MPWVVDTDFGNGLFKTNAKTPFTVSGNAGILSLCGVGALYRSEIDKLNVSLECKINIPHIGGANYGPSLIARRQANGNFYYANVYFDNFSGGSRFVSIKKYTASSDTITDLSYNSASSNALVVTYPSVILTFNFRVYNNNLFASLHKDNGDLLIATGTTDSAIALSGNPGLGANLEDNEGKNACFCDDFKIYDLI